MDVEIATHTPTRESVSVVRTETRSEEIRRLRHALGGAARPLATLDFWQDDDSWLMFSGIDNVDYNLAMLSGPEAHNRAEQVLETASRHDLPAMVFLPPGEEGACPALVAAGGRM